MSEWKRRPSKRQSDFIDTGRLGGPAPTPRQLVMSHSPGESLSPQSSHEERLLKAPDRPPLFTSQPGANLEAVLTHSEGPPQRSIASRTLPSLSTTNTAAYTLPPIYLPSPSQSLYTSHHVGRNLEHEINDNVVGTLQRENSDLNAAYSTAQVRIADLEEAAQALRVEIAKLAKDRQHLKARIDVLEAEVDQLQNSIEVSQQHTAAKDAQYSHIVEMSTKLQTQSACDTQQRNVEQEQWACEKRDMQDIILKLRSEVRSLQMGLSESVASHIVKIGDRPETSSQSATISTDQAALEQHSKSLQYANASMEAVLVGVMKEHAQLTQYIEKLGGIGRNIQTQLQGVSALSNVPRLLDGE